MMEPQHIWKRATLSLAAPVIALGGLLLVAFRDDGIAWMGAAHGQEIPSTVQQMLESTGWTPAQADPARHGLQATERPVYETIQESYIDPQTGERRVRQRTERRMVTEYRPIDEAAAIRAYQERKLESEAAKLAAELRDANEPAEREKLTEQLEKVLREAFEQQQQRWATQIEQLKTQLERLEQQRAERQERADLIVQRRLRQLTDGVDPLAWDAVPRPMTERIATAPAPQATYRSTRTPRWVTPQPDEFSSAGFLAESRPLKPAEPLPSGGLQPEVEVAGLADRLIAAAGSYLEAGKRLSQLRKSSTPSNERDAAEAAAGLAKARFQLALDAFAGTKELLELQLEAAKQREVTARTQLQQARQLREQGVLSSAELAKSEQSQTDAQTELRRTALMLQGWEHASQTTDPIVDEVHELSERLQATKKQYTQPSQGFKVE